VKYELGCYIPEDTILLSHRLENLKSYVANKFAVSFGGRIDLCDICRLLFATGFMALSVSMVA
jgi:hypothetical protein